jgi:hypothetical protein
LLGNLSRGHATLTLLVVNACPSSDFQPEHPHKPIKCYTQIADVLCLPLRRIFVRAEKLIATLALAAKVAAVRE